LSEILEAFLSIFKVVADNPASILIVLGFISIIFGWVFETSWLIVLGGFMLIAGIVVHVLWLSGR